MKILLTLKSAEPFKQSREEDEYIFEVEEV